MKQRLIKHLSLLLALALQIMPLMRSMLPSLTRGLAPSTWAIVFRWVVGTAGVMGYDAVSKASSLAISPATATIGVFYSGTVTYSGGHAGSVASCALSNAANPSFTCLGSVTLAPGLTISYPGSGNVCTVSGTPTGSPSTNSFHLKCFDRPSCGTGGNTDSKQHTTLVIVASGGGSTPPNIIVQPQSVIAQVGSDVILSGGATGIPAPQYYWKQGAAFIPGATNNTLTVPAVQLTSAGIYSLVASNASGSPTAACYLSVCQSPGSNILAFNFTNYFPAGNLVTLFTSVTNVPVATNTYLWGFNFSSNGIPNPYTNTLSFNAAPNKSGTYDMTFTSIVPTNTLIGSNNIIVNQQQYYSFWTFGFVPGVSTPPASVTTNAGNNATFNITVTGTTPTLLWYKNTATLVAVQTLAWNPNTPAAATNASLTLSNLSVSDSGSYTVVVTNNWGNITSSPPAILTVNSSATAPGITLQPSPQSVLVGQNASFSVTATGTAPLSYQWQKIGVGNLSNGGVYSGVNTNALNLAAVGLINAGSYFITITNIAGMINSTTNALSVSLPPATSLNPNGTGSAVLSATTIPGLTYIVQISTNLTDPAGWVPVLTNVAPGNGLVLFTNTTGNAQQFFRLWFP